MARGRRKKGESWRAETGLLARITSERPAAETREASSRVASSTATLSGLKTLKLRDSGGSERRSSGTGGGSPSGASSIVRKLGGASSSAGAVSVVTDAREI